LAVAQVDQRFPITATQHPAATVEPTRLDDFTENEFQDIPEYILKVFEGKDTVEDAIADLWAENEHVWDTIREALPTPSWHGTATPVRPLVLTHAIRIAKGWKNETAVVRFLNERDELVPELGYNSLSRVQQSKLWRAWEKRFPDRLKSYLEDLVGTVIECARLKNIPAPDEIFRPSEHTEDPSKRTERELVSKNTKEVWQEAKPLIDDSFHLNRGENTQIPEGAWWEQHTFLGMRSNMYAESGADSYRDDTSRERVPGGRHHRDKLRNLNVKETREMFQSATKDLVNHARRNSELVGNLTVAIDITKGNPWTGKVKREDGQIVEDHILGYKDGNLYYQWASIQVVGHDIPLVLDVLPVKRGEKRADIVDELLSTAKELVGGIELVMMDREFDADQIKQVCEEHDVYYLNPARKHTSERATCTRLRQNGKIVHIETESTFSSQDRKRIFLPSTGTDKNTAVGESHDTEPESDGPDESVRQEMMEEFAEIGGDTEELSEGETPFDDVVTEVKEEEQDSGNVGSIEDTQAYTLFETNHPSVQLSGENTSTDLIHMAERMVRRYKQRWGIENGFKKIKTFMVRTSSKDHSYRFFNFAFASMLYNVWRLVDLLVKISIEGTNTTYAPKVDAHRFLTHAKKHYGLPPPD